MYIKKTHRKYKDKVYTNYLLVEAVHTPQGPRQKVMCSLGDLHARSGDEWIELAHRVEDALVGQRDLFAGGDADVARIVRRVRKQREGNEEEQRRWEERRTEEEGGSDGSDLIGVHAEKVRTERHREAGPVHVGIQFWRKLGLDKILAEAGLSEYGRDLSCAMVMNRLIKPRSEHAMPHWIRGTALEDILGRDFSRLSHHTLYRNLDRLHPNRATIETALAEQERDLFNLERSVLLYDVTSTYFEGQALGNEKAKRGYSRDKRPDCAQVLVGLVINGDGFPLAHEVIEGNRQDRSTLGEMLDLLDKRVGLTPGQTVVVDRGMSFDDNLAEIGSRKLKYIVAARQTERDQWLSEFEEEEGFAEVVRIPSVTNPFQKKSRLHVKMKRAGKEAHVLCLSEERKEKDRAIRRKQEKRLLHDLKNLEKRIEKGRLKQEAKIGEAVGRLKERYPRVARYYKMEYDPEEKKFHGERDEQKLERAQSLDGSYLLKTDRDDLSAEEAWRVYTLLTRAEKAFRDMKSPLCERPIFHQISRRVDTHIFLCVIAYHLLTAIEKTLLDQEVHISWQTIRDMLSTHQISTVVLPTSDGAELHLRQDSVPEPEHVWMYDLLKIPHRIVEPRKKWRKNQQPI